MSGGRDEEARALRRAGDAARDARRWAEAAAAYGEYLERRPDDHGILVQRGHALKESGDPEAALALYRRAAGLAPDDPDIHLQIGHALKLLGRLGPALEAYGRGVAADPAARDAWEEWRALSVRAPAPRRAEGSLLDLSDLLSWHGAHRAPSGIQRVQSEIAAAALAAGPVTLCAMPSGARGWRALPAAAFLRLRHLSRTPGEDEAWIHTLGAIGAWLDRAPDLSFAPGDLLVTPGSAWWLAEYPDALRAARAAGLRHVPVLHDCGPLLLPEADPALRRDFARWFETLPALADGVIAVSEATAADYRRLMARHLPDAAAPPVAVVTPDGWTEPPAAPPPVRGGEAPGVLGGALGALGLRRPATPAAAAHPALSPGEPFILLVGSLEPRKGHALAFAAWQRLIERRGGQGTPRLVVAGRRAEGDAPALGMLEEDRALAARVTLLHALDDAAVARLYAACLFTLYPSRHEGWGLPVSESLGHGKVAVVPEASALVESGRNGAVFFVPGSAESLATTVESLLPEAARAAAEARIPPRGGLRDWSAVAADLLATARRLAGNGREAEPPLLPLLREISFLRSDAPDPRPGAVLAAALPEGPGWAPPGPDGLWSRRGRAALRFRVEEPGPLRLRLSVAVAPGARPRLLLRRAEAEEVVLEFDRPGLADLSPEIGAGGPEIALVLDGSVGRLPDGREAGLGLRAIGLMRGNDLAERIAYLEAQTLVPVLPEV